MDPLEILREDHVRLRSLFDRIEEAQDDAESGSLFDELRDELLAHSFTEENAFYPAFEAFESFSDLVEDSIEDHHEMKEILEEMEDLRPSGTISDDSDEGEFIDQLEDLRDLVEEHIETEEVEFFPRIPDVLNSDEFERLGRLVSDAQAGARRRAGRAA